MSHGQNVRAFPRRAFLRGAGGGLAAMSLAPLLAACGGGGDEEPAARDDGGFDWSAQREAGTVTMVNWPLYIDKQRVDGQPTHPSLDAFTEATGIEVEYLEGIDSLEEFHAKLFQTLDAGRSTGYDVIVTGFPKWFPLLIERGDLIPLDHSRLESFAEHAAPRYKDPSYDPGNRHGIPWQSGITGIGYDIEVTGRELTSVQELFDPEWAGKVGMFRDTLDTPSMALIATGADPSSSTEDDWRAAADLLTKQRDDGIVRQYYGQGYISALQSGDVAVTLAWSGDVLQSQNSGYENLRFAVPDEGGLLWTDIMAIPVMAEHPLDAITLMDWFYHPEIAAMLTSWIQNVSPVPEAQDILREQDDPVAENPLVFPTQEMYDRMRDYRVLDEAETETWNDLFLPVYQS
jgi:spermidine/putrescine transport system substrate-binding protein